jgi:hypothetical protein
LRLALLCLLLAACGRHYPHDEVPCTSDSECAQGNKCLPLWEHPDGGACQSTRKACKKPCAADSECSYCGDFGVCAVEACDPSGPKTCGLFCGDGK